MTIKIDPIHRCYPHAGDSPVAHPYTFTPTSKLTITPSIFVALLSSCSENGSLFQYLNSQQQHQHDKNTNSYVSVFLNEAPGFMDNIRIDR